MQLLLWHVVLEIGQCFDPIGQVDEVLAAVQISALHHALKVLNVFGVFEELLALCGSARGDQV